MSTETEGVGKSDLNGCLAGFRLGHSPSRRLRPADRS